MHDKSYWFWSTLSSKFCFHRATKIQVYDGKVQKAGHIQKHLYYGKHNFTVVKKPKCDLSHCKTNSSVHGLRLESQSAKG